MNAMPILAPIRPEVLAIETQQIMQVSTLAMDDPEVIAMWYGESDITTPEFICDAAASALRRGQTNRGGCREQQCFRRIRAQRIGFGARLETVAERR